MTLILRLIIISSGSKCKEPRCACVSEAKVSHSHKMCTEVSSSAPHYLPVGLLLNPIMYRRLLRVLYTVRGPVTTLDLLKDRAFVTGLGPTVCSYLYRVIHKSFRDFRPLRYSSRDGHAEGEHVNRRRDTPSFCPTLQVLDMLTSDGF